MPKDMRTEKHHQNDFAILGRIYGGLPHLLSLERDCYYIKFCSNVKHFCKIQYHFSVFTETPPEAALTDENCFTGKRNLQRGITPPLSILRSSSQYSSSRRGPW